jgi:hypothetical protein
MFISFCVFVFNIAVLQYHIQTLSHITKCCPRISPVHNISQEYTSVVVKIKVLVDRFNSNNNKNTKTTKKAKK